MHTNTYTQTHTHTHTHTHTQGIVAILGTTYTGAFYDVEALDALVAAKNAAEGLQLAIHVDGASGGFVAPFAYPELKWCAGRARLCM